MRGQRFISFFVKLYIAALVLKLEAKKTPLM